MQQWENQRMRPQASSRTSRASHFSRGARKRFLMSPGGKSLPCGPKTGRHSARPASAVQPVRQMYVRTCCTYVCMLPMARYVVERSMYGTSQKLSGPTTGQSGIRRTHDSVKTLTFFMFSSVDYNCFTELKPYLSSLIL